MIPLGNMCWTAGGEHFILDGPTTGLPDSTQVVGWLALGELAIVISVVVWQRPWYLIITRGGTIGWTDYVEEAT